MHLIFTCICIGLGAGILGGLFGIGGGIVMVPALMIFFNLSQLKAQGTSLFALLAPVSILGVLKYSQSHEVDFIKGGWIILGLIFGTFLGAQFALNLPPLTLRRLLASFYLLAAIYIFFKS